MKIYFLVRIDLIIFMLLLVLYIVMQLSHSFYLTNHQRMEQLGDANETTSLLNCGCLYKQEFLL